MLFSKPSEQFLVPYIILWRFAKTHTGMKGKKKKKKWV